MVGAKGLSVTELDERLVERFINKDGKKADSTGAIEKRSGSFWIIFESATLLPSHSRFVMTLRWPRF